MEDESTEKADHAAIAQMFCNTIKNAGYAVGVYANTSWWNTYLTNGCFSQWYRWVAEWGPSCNYAGTYAIWQYSAEGSVPGINGKVDMNYLIGYPDDHGTPIGIEVPSEVTSAVTYSSHISDSASPRMPLPTAGGWSAPRPCRQAWGCACADCRRNIPLP